MTQGDQVARSMRTRQASSRVLKPACERLEARKLMSLFSFLDPVAAPRPIAPPSSLSSSKPTGRTEGLYQLSLGSHPLYQSVENGRVVKAPMYSAAYRGPKRKDLDATAASAFISPERNYVLIGKVLGPIQVADAASYNFLINRGGARSPGPLALRPRILYDAQVNVTTGPEGPSGSVSLLDQQGSGAEPTRLAPGAVSITGTTVRINVPGELLPATRSPRGGPAVNRYTFAFTAGLPGSKPADIASFLPEYVPAAIGGAVGRVMPPRTRPARFSVLAGS